MTDPELPSDLDALLNKLVEGTLLPDEHSRLENLLSVSRGARTRYLRFIDTQMDLESLYGNPPETTLESLVARLESINQQQVSRKKHSWRQSLLLACMTLLLGGIGFWISLRPESSGISESGRASQESAGPTVRSQSMPTNQTASPVAARLTQAAEAELFGQLIPELGASLPAEEEFVLIRGAILLTFQNGAETLIEAPSVFTIETAERLNLKTGRCSVHAPPGAEGFEVITPVTRVVDLGTRFAVNVDEVGASEVHVIEGAAEVYPAGAAQRMNRLEKGDARRSTDEAQLSAIPFNQKAFRRALPDRVISYQASPDPAAPGFVRDLQNVTLQRGGKLTSYEVQELIGIDVLDFVSEGDASCLVWEGEFPSDPTIALRDNALNTGICNFGSIAAARLSNEKRRGERPSQRGAPRMEIRFHQPVINSEGPDIVLFEVQPAIHAMEGDAFTVRPRVEFAGGRKHRISRFDITMNSRNALRISHLRMAEYKLAPQSLEDFVKIPYQWKTLKFPFYVLAVGIDLSDLGYAPGEACTELILEDGDDDRNFVDPVFIGGLPPVAP